MPDPVSPVPRPLPCVLCVGSKQSNEKSVKVKVRKRERDSRTFPSLFETGTKQVFPSSSSIADKDIRAQIHGAGSDSSYSSHGASHHLISCDASRLLQASSSAQGVNGAGGAASSSALATGGNEAAFYQIESPPCYTIATGLPSYAEALRHQPRHFAYGMRFMLPSLAAVHHHHHQQQQQHLCQRACIANWEKDAVQRSSNKLQKCKLSAADEATWRQTQTQTQSQIQTQTEDKASPAICINMPDEQQREGEQDREQHRNAAAETLLPAAAADDDCASLVVVVAA